MTYYTIQINVKDKRDDLIKIIKGEDLSSEVLDMIDINVKEILI